MVQVLVTRPTQYAQGLCVRLQALGHSSIVHPLLDIVPLETSRPPLDEQPIVVITSQTTLLVLSMRKREVEDLLPLPCYCVGEKTAARAEAFGFKKVRNVDGDGVALARLVMDQQPKREILHIGGQHKSEEPDLSFEKAGWVVKNWPVYKAEPVTKLADGLVEKIRERGIDFALFYSVRTALTFIDLMRQHKLEPCCQSLIAVGLSEAVVRALEPLPFAKRLVADHPSEDGMIRALSAQTQIERTTMTDQNEAPQPEAKETAKAVPSPAKSKTPLLIVSLLALFGLVGGFFFMSGQIPFAPANSGQAELAGRLAALESKTKGLEEKLEKISISEASTKTETAEETSALTSVTEIEKLKLGLAGLSSALSLLQTELEKSSQITNEDRLNTQAGLATLMAFMQMQRTALNGNAFENERQVLRRLAESDKVLIEQLLAVERFALHGVPTQAKIMQSWRKTSHEAQAALRKAGAQTWMDRIVVALEGLVSIRSLNPKAGDSLSFAAITLDLDEGNLRQAVEKAQALPQNVQDAIKPWLASAQDRIEMEKILEAMSTHLIERGAAPQPAPASDFNAPATPDAAQQ